MDVDRIGSCGILSARIIATTARMGLLIFFLALCVRQGLGQGASTIILGPIEGELEKETDRSGSGYDLPVNRSYHFQGNCGSWRSAPCLTQAKPSFVFLFPDRRKSNFRWFVQGQPQTKGEGIVSRRIFSGSVRLIGMRSDG